MHNDDTGHSYGQHYATAETGIVIFRTPHMYDAEDNAAFIIHACNSHDAMVEALNMALGYIEAVERKSGWKTDVNALAASIKKWKHTYGG